MIGYTALGLAGVAILFFAGALWKAPGTAGESADWLAVVALAGGIVVAAGMLLIAGLGVMLADIAGRRVSRLDAGGVQTIHVLLYDLAIPIAGGMAATLFATAIVAIRTGTLPRWLGWIAIILGAGCLTPAGLAAFLVSSLWVVAVAVLLSRRSPVSSAL